MPLAEILFADVKLPEGLIELVEAEHLEAWSHASFNGDPSGSPLGPPTLVNYKFWWILGTARTWWD